MTDLIKHYAETFTKLREYDMNTPDKRVEEIKSEFRMFVPEDDGSAMDWLENRLEEMRLETVIIERTGLLQLVVEDVPLQYQERLVEFLTPPKYDTR